MSEKANSIIGPLLEPDEEILWSGQPKIGQHLAKGDWFLESFSAAIFLLGISWATTGGGWGWSISVLGFYLVLGRFAVKAWRKRSTYYAVTSTRLVSLVGSKGRVQPFHEVPVMQVSARNSGNGTIRFSDKPGYAAVYQNSGMEWISISGGPDEIAFYDIDEVAEVRDLVLRLKGEMSEAAPDA